MRDRRRDVDERVLRRTQLTIAVVRGSFAILATTAAVGVLIDGRHNRDEYELPLVSVTVQLWQVLALTIGVLAVVFIGAVAEFARGRRQRFAR